MTATVAVVGGGYGGITVAQALDDVADVVLIDPKDAFVHNVAALRAIVDPSWAEQMFMPYSGLLKRGRVIEDWVVSVEAHGLWLSSGGFMQADYIVIATGTSYPFPAKVGSHHAEAARRRIQATSEALYQAGHVLLLGAGPVGLELAGEISSAWPQKGVTVVDPAGEILSGTFMADFDPELSQRMRDMLHQQLMERGTRLILGTAPEHSLPVPAGTLQTSTTTMRSGETVTADIWFRCHGRQPASRVLGRSLSMVRRHDDLIEVMPDLRLRGQRRVFAIGDVTATGALDTAVVAIEQAGVVADNIRFLLTGEGELGTYQPTQPVLSIPLGPTGGVTYIPDAGILDGDATAEIKGGDLFVGRYAAMFGLSG